MTKRRIGKKIAAWLMCLAMVLSTVNLPAFTTTVQAEESWVEVSTYDALKTELAKSGDKHIKLVADISNVDTINKNKLVHSDGDTTLDLNGFNIRRVPEESTDDRLFSIEGGAICIINSTETKSTIYFENSHAAIPRTIGVENGASLVVGKPYNCGPILVDAAPGQRAISTSGFTNMFSCVTLGTEVSKAQFLASPVSNGYINGPTIYGGINCQGNYVINAAKVYGIAESTVNWALDLSEDAKICSDSEIYVDNVKTDLTKGASSYYVTQGTNEMTEIRHVSHYFESVSRDEVTLEKPSGTEYFVCTSCGATKTEPVSFDCYAGSNCAYKFDEENKTLTIYGTGETKDYNYSKRSELAPWFIGDNKSKFDKVEKIVIEDGITSIGTESFVYLSEINTVLQEVEIGTNVVGIYNDAFRNCAKLSKINWPSSVSSIGTGCFSGNRALTNIEFPNNEYLTIGSYAFNNCGALTNIKIPGGAVQTGAFSLCPKLTTVTFGNKIKSLQDKIFEGDSELKDIYFEGNPPATFASNAFYGVTATAHYPEGNSTWDSVITNQYGGTITWVSHTHSGNLVPQKDATCTEFGVKEHYECSCGMAFFDSACTREITDFEAWKASEGKIEKKSHSYTIEETAEVPATCTTDGTTAVMKCATCTTTQGGETIPATGNHDFSAQPYHVTDDKTQHYQECKDCGAKSIPVDHVDTEIKNKKEATCTEKGYTGDTCCKDCGAVIKNGTEVNAKGHTEVIIPAKEATCKEAGLTEGKKCSVCGTVTVAQTEIKKLEHTWDAGKVTKEASETEEGAKTFTCTVCDYTKTETIPKKKVETLGPESGETKLPVVKAVMSFTSADLESKTPEELNQIAKAAIEKAVNDSIGAGVPFTSAKTTLDIKINAGDVALAEGTDYTIAYKNNINADSDTQVVVKFTGDYKKLGTVTQPFKIKPASIEDEKFSVADITFTDKQKGKAAAKPVVFYNGKKIKLGKDYNLMIQNETGTFDAYNGKDKLSNSTVIKVVGTKNFTGEKLVKVTFLAADDARILLDKASVKGVKAQTATGSSITQDMSKIIVKAGGKTLVFDKDYTVTYQNNVNVGTAAMIITAKEGSEFIGSRLVVFKINGTKLSKAAVKLEADGKEIGTRKGMEAVEKGTAIEPKVTLTLDGQTLTEGTDFKVAFKKNRKKGSAQVIITGTGKYTGTKKAAFKIINK